MKRPKLWSRHNLPEDLWPEILSRLPVKTLLRFRCVRKQWRELIDDPDFARLHLRQFSNNLCETHLCLNEPLGPKKVQVRNIQSVKMTSRFHIPQTILDSGKWCGYWNALSSIDGLFMLKQPGRSLRLMLWNPATRKTLILPPSPEISISVFDLFVEDLGLGFDPAINNYKHVRVMKNFAGGPHSVAVYSLATKSWKMTRSNQGDLQRFRIRCSDGHSSLCLKGFLFRFATINYSVKKLVSFDFRSEALAFISLPAEVEAEQHRCSPWLTMVDDGSSLAVIIFSDGSGSIWVLKGLEADDINSCTWSKRYTFSSMIPELHSSAWCGWFFHLLKNGEMLFWWSDLKPKKEKAIIKKCMSNALPYIESLVEW